MEASLRKNTELKYKTFKLDPLPTEIDKQPHLDSGSLQFNWLNLIRRQPVIVRPIRHRLDEIAAGVRRVVF